MVIESLLSEFGQNDHQERTPLYYDDFQYTKMDQAEGDYMRRLNSGIFRNFDPRE